MKTPLPLLPLLALTMVSAIVAEPSAPKQALLVVSPKSFETALRGFVAWKQSLLPTEWISLEEVLRTSPGADDPEKIKRFLHRKWNEQGLGYVLLVGDVGVLPVRYMVLDRKTEAAFNRAFYPSDLYYADLAETDGSFEDWNAQKDGYHAGYFGEVHGEHIKTDTINYDQVDYQPEVAVGRWPAGTADEARRIAEKSMAQERRVLADSDPKLRRAGFIAVDGWVDSRPLLRDLTGRLDDRWSIQSRLYGTDSPPPDGKEVLGLLNEGVGLMVHTGHGSPGSWEQCLSIGDLDRMTNADNLPVFISAGCSTAHFAPLPPYEAYVDRDGKPHVGTDRGEKFTKPPPPPSPIQAGAFNPTCLGEQLLKKEGGGGVAYIGCNTGSQPFGLTLLDGFIREVATSDKPRLGDCWNCAVRFYIQQQKLADLKPTDSWEPPSVFFQAMKFMVFGDPSLRLPGKTAEPPAAVDLRPVLEQAGVMPRQQGARGTCSVFTVTLALEYALSRVEKPAGRLSVEYLNWASNQSVGQSADGGFFSDLWKGFHEYGICLEEEMTYAARFDPDRKPEPEVITKASQRADKLRMNWIKPWNVRTGLTESEFANIRRTLSEGFPVCAGLRWPKNVRWKDGVLEMRPPDAVFDGHSVLITGYQEDRSQPGGGTLRFYNSNLPDMECRMSWEYARAYMNDAMWIEAAAR